MTSPRQRKANAQNAKKSKGPITQKGKAVSSHNATKHGLNKKIDPLAHPVVVIEELYIQEGVDPEAARRLALAHVERERVRRARVTHWQDEYLMGYISGEHRGALHDATPEFLSKLDESFQGDDGWQKLLPNLFLEPYGSEAERDADVASRVLKRLISFNRYEVRAVNKIKKAAKAAFLPLSKAMNTQKMEALIKAEEPLKQK